MMNVLLIAIDALRADHLGCYGYHKKTSPTIDRLAREGVRFSNCFAQGNCTHPGFTTIFTGLYPLSHDIVAHWPPVDLDEGIPMLPEILKERGYATVAIDNLYDRFARTIRLYPWFRRGYDWYLYPQEEGGTKEYGRATEVTDLAISWLRENYKSKFFMFLHYWDPHQPYDPPQKHRKFYDNGDANRYKNLYLDPEEVNNWISLYDGEINYVDEEIGRLLKEIITLGIEKDTLIIVLSDHGETMGENRTWLGTPDCFTHRDLYDPTIHVPLIFKGTDKIPSGRVIHELVQHVDIAPTILDILEIENTYDMDGVSLLPLIKGEETRVHDMVYFSENTYQCKRGVRTKEWKFLKVMDDELYGVPPKELYNLKEDPRELLNLVDRNRDVAEDLERRMEEFVRSILKKRKKKDPLIEQDITAGRRIRDSFGISKRR